jgi:hypothetical protein
MAGCGKSEAPAATLDPALQALARPKGGFCASTGSVELDLLQRAPPSIFVYAGQRSHVGAAFQVLTLA